MAQAAKRKVLVTGAAGFVGSHTVDLLVERGHDVTGVDNLDPQVHGKDAKYPANLASHVENKTIRFVLGDVRDRATMTPLVTDADAVIHLAAAVGVGQSMYQPHYYSDVNIGGTAMLMDLLANASHKVRKVVVASSMSIYGEGSYRCTACGKRPVYPTERAESALAARKWEHPCPSCGGTLAPEQTPEEKPLHSTSIYAISKKVQEEMLLCFGKAYKIPTVALRYFNIYGPRQSLNNPYTGVAAIFLSRLLNGAAPVVFEDGLQSRDFIHVRDIARANLLALESSDTGQTLYNVGTGRPTTVLDVARTLAGQLGVDIQPAIAHKFRAGDIRHCFGDPSRIEAALGWKAEISLEEGYRDLIAWSRAQKPTDTFAASLTELEQRKLVG